MEYQRNMELSSQLASTQLKQVEQESTQQASSSELVAIKQQLKDYRNATQQKDDSSKFNKAYQNISATTDITELTMLALKITENLKCAEANQQSH